MLKWLPTDLQRALATIILTMSLLLPATGQAQEAATKPKGAQQLTLLDLGKPLKAPRSYFLKAACPSFAGCCCVIGGYAHCMTSIECAAIGGGCTGRC